MTSPARASKAGAPGKRYFVTGNTFTAVGTALEIDPREAGSIVSEASDGLTEAIAAFEAIYGVDIGGP